MEVLRGHAPPRLSAAVLSTLLNRWCTERRFQREGPCLFGCVDQADSIEHYLACRVFRTFTRTFLGSCSPALEDREWHLLAHEALDSPGKIVKVAIGLYAAYRATQRLRRLPPHQRAALSQDEISRMLQQAAREGVRGHARTIALMECPVPA